MAFRYCLWVGSRHTRLSKAKCKRSKRIRSRSSADFSRPSRIRLHLSSTKEGLLVMRLAYCKRPLLFYYAGEMNERFWHRDRGQHAWMIQICSVVYCGGSLGKSLRGDVFEKLTRNSHERPDTVRPIHRRSFAAIS